MERVLVLTIFLHSVSAFSDCKPGKITGISCPSPQDVIAEFESSIDNLRNSIKTVLKSTNDNIVSTKLLVNDNIQNAKSLAQQKFAKTRSLLNQAKIEAAKARPKVRGCVVTQNLEFAKIRPANFLDCLGNFSTVATLKNQILQLQQVAFQLVPICTRLNPFQSKNLRMCLDLKIKNLELQLTLLEHDLTKSIKDLVNFSTSCIVREAGDLYSKIGAVEGAVKNCKDVR